jgi:hypothetical protein
MMSQPTATQQYVSNIPVLVFMVMSAVPIMQVIAPHITVMLVDNPILNYPSYLWLEYLRNGL